MVAKNAFSLAIVFSMDTGAWTVITMAWMSHPKATWYINNDKCLGFRPSARARHWSGMARGAYTSVVIPT